MAWLANIDAVCEGTRITRVNRGSGSHDARHRKFFQTRIIDMHNSLQRRLIGLLLPLFIVGSLAACQRAGEDAGAGSAGGSDSGTTQSGGGMPEDSGAAGASGGGTDSTPPESKPEPEPESGSSSKPSSSQ